MDKFMEYRPILEYKKELEAIIQETGILNENSPYPDEGLPPLREQEFELHSNQNGYQPSKPVLDTIVVTPTDILYNLLEAKRKINEIKSEIIENLKDNITKGPTVQDYIEARESVSSGNGRTPNNKNAQDIINYFEEMNEEDIEGSTSAEILPILYDLEEELDMLEEFTIPYLKDTGIVVAPSIQDLENGLDNFDLEKAREEEKREVQEMANQDRKNTFPRDKANETNHVKKYLNERPKSISDFADSMKSILDMEQANPYQEMKEQIPASSSDQIQRIGLTRFKHYAENAADAKRRMKRIVDPHYKKLMLEEVKEWQRHKLRNRQVISEIQASNPPTEDDPIIIYYIDILEGIKQMNEKCNLLTKDLYKTTELEGLQMNDYAVSMIGKSQVRQWYKVIGQDERDIDI